MFCQPHGGDHVTAQRPPTPSLPGGDAKNSALSSGQPLAAGGDMKGGELKIASQYPPVQHPCRIGYPDSDLAFLRAFVNSKK
jgi:hypothetical protein